MATIEEQAAIKTLQELQEGETIKCYVVISVKELRNLLKHGREISKSTYHGKVRGQSCSVLDITILCKKSAISNSGKLQGRIEGSY